MIPAEFVGAWRRESIAIGDGVPVVDEPTDVVWLQARSGFADLRLPRRDGAEPMAFAGVTTWDAPALTWHHHVGVDQGRTWTDVGAVEWRGDRLVERGAAVVDGEPATYEEVWARLAPARLPILVLAHEDGGHGDAVLVRIGEHALVMGRTREGFAARHDRLVDGLWTEVGALGTFWSPSKAPAPARVAGGAPASAAGDLPAVPCADPSWRPGQLVELCGAPWRVREIE